MAQPETEKWAWVPGYEGIAEVSSLGRVRKYLAPCPDSDGYLLVTIVSPRHASALRRRSQAIHRIAAAAFLGPRPEGLVVNHKDGNKANNSVSNLEYITQKENNAHAARHGLTPHGEGNGRAKLKQRDVRMIRKLYASGKHSMKQIAHEYEMSESAIQRVVRKSSWKRIQPKGGEDEPERNRESPA